MATGTSIDLTRSPGSAGSLEMRHFADGSLPVGDIQTGGLNLQSITAGSVTLAAAGSILNSAPIMATGTAGAPGSISVQADLAVVQSASAVLDASSTGPAGTVSVEAGERLFSSASIVANGTGASGIGGTIELTAPSVTLAGAQLDASGAVGGGTILLSSSNQTTVNASTTLRADATAVGAGGQITVSSDGTTTYRGTSSARGSGSGGDGGVITLSGKERLVYGGQADASAPQGNAGRLLLDLNNIVIQSEAPGVSYDVLTLGSPFSGSGNGFAQEVVVLQGGNIVATDPYSAAFGTNSGAVYNDKYNNSMYTRRGILIKLASGLVSTSFS